MLHLERRAARVFHLSVFVMIMAALYTHFCNDLLDGSLTTPPVSGVNVQSDMASINRTSFGLNFKAAEKANMWEAE